MTAHSGAWIRMLVSALLVAAFAAPPAFAEKARKRGHGDDATRRRAKKPKERGRSARKARKKCIARYHACRGKCRRRASFRKRLECRTKSKCFSNYRRCREGKK